MFLYSTKETSFFGEKMDKNIRGEIRSSPLKTGFVLSGGG